MNRIVPILLVATCMLAAADEIDKRDLEQARKHHAALAEKDRDIEDLKRALAKARAEGEMCQDRAKKAPDLGGSRDPLDK